MSALALSPISANVKHLRSRWRSIGLAASRLVWFNKHAILAQWTESCADVGEAGHSQSRGATLST